MPSAVSPIHVRPVTSLRAIFRSSEAALVVLTIGIGIAAGLLTIMQHRIAHGLQKLLYAFPGDSLSASSGIDPVRLIALPIGGLILGFGSRAVLRRWRTPVDVVEANALHGGAVPWKDSTLVCVQTLLSNGVGASVGLEAAYAQAGGGFASMIGQWLRLRRADMRIIVGAGAGAAIGAAFGAPLTGAFYAFEIVIGAYTPAAIAPVAAACLSAVLLVRFAGLPAYLVALPGARAITTEDYVLYAVLGIVCAAVGIAIMRGMTVIEGRIRALRLPDALRPAIGGLILIPLALVTPQSLSAGHGALHMDLGAEIPLTVILTVFLVKISASAVSLGFGFRGGLFFASLFIGSLAGQLFAGTLAHIPQLPTLDPTDAALIGMAAMAVAIVGAPMTMSMLVLETTHDFALTGVAIMAGLCASTVVRETFGFSFSTWRMHTRGESIRSARDVGWAAQPHGRQDDAARAGFGSGSDEGRGFPPPLPARLDEPGGRHRPGRRLCGDGRDRQGLRSGRPAGQRNRQHRRPAGRDARPGAGRPNRHGHLRRQRSALPGGRQRQGRSRRHACGTLRSSPLRQRDGKGAPRGVR